LTQTPFWLACQSKNNEINHSITDVVFLANLEILFPEKSGPGIKDINTLAHIHSYLKDKNIDPNEQDFLIKGTVWVQETAIEIFDKPYQSLPKNEQKKIIEKILKTNWGESWLSKLLTLNFEALLLDPIYNVNLNEVGWKWLQHKPGIPRPNHKNKYPEILNRKNEDTIITNLNQL